MATSVRLLVSESRYGIAQEIDATAELAPNGGTFTIPGLTQWKTYYIRAVITDASGSERVYYLGSGRPIIDDTTDPTVEQFSIEAGDDSEVELVLNLILQDIVA